MFDWQIESRPCTDKQVNTQRHWHCRTWVHVRRSDGDDRGFPRHVLGGAAGCNRSSGGGNCAEIHKLLSACGFWFTCTQKPKRPDTHTHTHTHTLSSAYSKVCLRPVCWVVTEAGLLWACADRSSLLLYWVLNHPVKPRGDVPPRSSIDHFPWHVSMSSLWRLLSA